MTGNDQWPIKGSHDCSDRHLNSATNHWRQTPFDRNQSADTHFKMLEYTTEELDALAIVDSDVDTIRKSGKIPKPDIDYTDSEQAVKNLRELFKSWTRPVENESVDCSLSSYRTRDGHENRLLVFRPAGLPKEHQLPLIIHIHGGGGCLGSPESTTRICQNLTLQNQCVVVTISYRLAPEFKFPIGRKDCFDAVKHVATHATDFGADLSLGFIIGGHSYGASAAAVISLHTKEIGIEAPITGLYLGAGSYIGKDIPEGYQEYLRSKTDERCQDSPILDRKTWALFGASYNADFTSEWAKACNTNQADPFKGQPRAYFQVCGMDILRDESLIYGDILKSNGVDTRFDIYPGMPHIFWDVFGPGTTKQGDKWAVDTIEGFKWLLHRN
jgi:acetyl esterase/lipase